MKTTTLKLDGCEMQFVIVPNLTIPRRSARTFVAALHHAEEEGYWPDHGQLATALGVTQVAVSKNETPLWDAGVLIGTRRPRKITGVQPAAVVDSELAKLILVLGIIQQEEEFIDCRQDPLSLDEVMSCPLAVELGLTNTHARNTLYSLALDGIVRLGEREIVLNRRMWNKLKLVYYEIAALSHSFYMARKQYCSGEAPWLKEHGGVLPEKSADILEKGIVNLEDIDEGIFEKYGEGIPKSAGDILADEIFERDHGYSPAERKEMQEKKKKRERRS